MARVMFVALTDDLEPAPVRVLPTSAATPTTTRVLRRVYPVMP